MDALDSTSRSSSGVPDTAVPQTDDTPTSNPEYLSVPPDLFYYVMRYISALQISITLSGIVTNTLCIRTFFRIGLKECVTITFFNLAISDLGFLLLNVVHWTIYLLYIMEFPTILGVKAYDLIFFVSLPREIFFFPSSYFITFLAVQRSLCVLLPLRFKGMFTRTRTCIILAVIWGYSLFCKAMDFSIYSLSEQWSDETNSTVLAIYYPRPALRKHVRKWTNIMNNVVLFLLSNAVVLGSVFILTYALKKSARFREKTSTSGLAASTQTKSKGKTESQDGKGGGTQGGVSKSGGAASISKERQAIVQVVILSVLYLLAFLPGSVFFGLRYGSPSLFVMENFYFFELYIRIYMIFMMANASVNFLVYYKCNTTFRQHCFRQNACVRKNH